MSLILVTVRHDKANVYGQQPLFAKNSFLPQVFFPTPEFYTTKPN